MYCDLFTCLFVKMSCHLALPSVLLLGITSLLQLSSAQRFGLREWRSKDAAHSENVMARKSG